MKKLIILFVSVLFSVNQAFAATASGTSNVKVVTVLQLAAGQALEFGSIATTGTDGSVTINAANPTGLGNNVTLVSSGATRTAGTFAVSNGEADTTYTVTLPSGNVSLSSGSNTITVNGFNFIEGTASRRLSSSGTDNFSVGAVLNVTANQAPGSYTGNYTVTANYN